MSKVSNFVGKTPLRPRAFTALELPADKQTAPRVLRAVLRQESIGLPVTDKAINAVDNRITHDLQDDIKNEITDKTNLTSSTLPKMTICRINHNIILTHLKYILLPGEIAVVMPVEQAHRAHRNQGQRLDGEIG
jgi:hypothetical protein